MAIIDLARQVEQDPVAAQEAFVCVETAINLVLPGSDVHPRYREIEGVGLALTIGPALVQPNAYNPLDPTSPSRLFFSADNRHLQPAAWLPLETDERWLGGVMPENIGRLTVFAMAKMNALTFTAALGSHREDGIAIGPGRVGFAGGHRVAESLLALSGLWEVHDHVAGKLYVDRIDRGESPDTTPKTADALADDLERIFGQICSHQAGVEATALTRRQLAQLLVVADRLLADLLQH